MDLPGIRSAVRTLTRLLPSQENVVIHRLYREATKFHNGAHVKDLSALNRGLKNVRIARSDAFV